MLTGKSPTYLENKNLDTISTIQEKVTSYTWFWLLWKYINKRIVQMFFLFFLSKMKNVTSQMTDFISEIKYVTNYQSGIMENANEVIKENLPVDVVSQINVKNLHVQIL